MSQTAVPIILTLMLTLTLNWLAVQSDAFIIHGTSHSRSSSTNTARRNFSIKNNSINSDHNSHIMEADGNDRNPREVDRVSVCLGELCKCQEESSELILQDLLSRNLPYVVEDAPCLGACGVGAMVSIEYQDGGYALVTGQQETFQAVGIEGFNEMNNVWDEIGVDDTIDEDVRTIDIVAQAKYESIGVQNAPTTLKINDSSLSTLSTRSTTRDDHGAVKRMREEAVSSNEEITNPWVNMAVYLANKAKDSLLK